MSWTELTRPDYDRRFLKYASDVTDEEWDIIRPFVSVRSLVVRWRPAKLRQVWNAIQYIGATGCQWAMLPKDFPAFNMVQSYDYKWRNQRLFDVINEALVMAGTMPKTGQRLGDVCQIKRKLDLDRIHKNTHKKNRKTNKINNLILIQTLRGVAPYRAGYKGFLARHCINSFAEKN